MEMHTDWRGRNKTVPIWRQHDSVGRKFQQNHKTIPRTNKLGKVAGYKISIWVNHISVYQQWTNGCQHLKIQKHVQFLKINTQV